MLGQTSDPHTMLDLGSTEFHLAVPSVPAPELEALSTSLFDGWEAFTERSLALPDYSIFLQVEEGSIKGAARIGAILGVVYLGIGNYGDFVSGVKTITEQLSSTKDFLTEHARKVFSCTEAATTSRKRGGSLVAIQRLFTKVQQGTMTPDEAMVQAELILGDESATAPNFIKDLENSLRTCPRFHEQFLLPLDPQGDSQALETDDTKYPTKPNRHKPTLPPPIQYRVEVWRESKDKHKQTRVTQL